MPSRRAALFGAISAGTFFINHSALGRGVATLSDHVNTVLFDVAALVDPGASEIVIPLHAWVYTPQASRARRRLAVAFFDERYGLKVTDANRALFDRRINLLFADNQPDVTLTVLVRAQGGADLARLTLPPTRPNGHTHAVLRLPTAAVPGDARSLELRVEGRGGSRAIVRLVGREGLSVVSDIDDTVKVTGVTERRSLWEATFFAPFTAVEGMSALLERIAGADQAVHYVSSSPWHFYDPLREWMREAALPVASLELKQIRLKDRSITNILKSPTETKPPAIAALMAQFPKRRFVLVGDSGEKDPEIYAAVGREHPERIAGIVIRRARGGENGVARFAALARDLPTGLLQTFDAPGEVDVARMLQSK